MKQEILRAGAAVTEITPPLEVGLLASAVDGLYTPFKSVRLPLKARVLALISGKDTIVIVSLDLLALSDTSTGGWEGFKRSLSDTIPPSNIIITCTHTHSAPESVALSDLYLTEAFGNWLKDVKNRISECISMAVNAAVACSPLYGMADLEGYSMQRRIPTPQGIIMSDAVQPVSPELLNRTPVDRRVRALRFVNGEGAVIATVVHAVCHPVHEMCIPHISPDFPGEMCNALEDSGENGTVLFLNGAAGNINPPTVSCGPGSAHAHGEALARVVQDECGRSPAGDPAFGFIHKEIPFAVRAGFALTNKLDAVCRLNALALGASLAVVFLPGEPFVEIGFGIEKNSPFTHTLVACFAENTVGYIPTANALKEGGYEAGPGKWSFLEMGADTVMQQAAVELLKELKKRLK